MNQNRKTVSTGPVTQEGKAIASKMQPPKASLLRRIYLGKTRQSSTL
ncbi:hypothetical protein [Polynucleobacter sp. IMCC 30228]|nr:hypothetical protein [Polynucleobacter sp. IMCC 30228]MCE7527872.1 hypothetical protein [Polynucleobacter sp. IMCC 30228]